MVLSGFHSCGDRRCENCRQSGQ